MIRRLRVKFVCVNMLIVTVMLCIILGMVLHFTGQTMQMQSVSMMQRVASHPFHLGVVGEASSEIQLPFFTVQLGPRGELLSAYGGYYDLTDREFIQEIVNAAFAEETESGVLKNYHLRFCIDFSGAGQRIVFADTTAEETTMRNLTYACVAIGIIAFIAFFWISILLSRWAVRPVAAAWEQQRQFVADASHELKTPLAVIMANAELLEAEGYSEQERRKFSGSILSMTYQMRRLVENLLEMARVDNGAVKMAELDFSQLVSDAVLSFQLLYEEQGLRLSGTIPEGICMQGSESHLFQVLDVLLDNALKYSTPGGTVYVALTRSHRNCRLTVASPGEAISREDLTNIFKRFYRTDKARSSGGSYGLGLSIAQAVVQSHKGKIWAESRGGYNYFHVQLPVNA